MKNWHVILGASALIALTIAFVFRWEIAAGTGRIYRIDRWTGNIVECNAPSQRVIDGSSFGFGVSFRCEDITAEERANNKLNPKTR